MEEEDENDTRRGDQEEVIKFPMLVFQYRDKIHAGNMASLQVLVTWNKILMTTREKGTNYLVLTNENKEW